ncbi:MAG: ribonuclease III [Peptostreptococcaceae bacterium]|nr:ribonuclease III [Peptostreptococcaceae bacterium]
MTILKKLESKIEYTFKDPLLLREALTHTSYANEHRGYKVKNNERLEFLGDSVLNLIITTHLFARLKNISEGEMSRIRSTIVCEKSLRIAADLFELHRFILLGRGEEQNGGRARDSIIADAMEALIGAIYCDSGIQEATRFVIKYMTELIDSGIQGKLFKDYKTQYQELVQKNKDARIEYLVVNEKGPDHKKTFTVELFLDGRSVSTGEGKNKKEAEQNAAREAMIIWEK